MVHDGKYTVLNIAPTINKNTTEYNAEGAWVDGDHIRFKDGRPETIGGWQTYTTSAIEGVARDIHTFIELDLTPHIAIGTHLKLELEQLGTIYDITPVVKTTSTTDAFSTTSGDSTVSIEDVSHDQAAGNRIILDNVSVGGLTLNGEYEITAITDADNYTIEAGSNASSTVNGGGGSEDIEYLLPVGLQSNGIALGWGAGTWNTPGASNGGWNDPRSGTPISVKLRQWSLDNWGEDLVACPRGGEIYLWEVSPSAINRAAKIANSPDENNLVMVAHPRRQLISFGTIPEGGSELDPLYIRWTDREDLTQWATGTTNRAGGIRLNKGNYIVGAASTEREILVLTDSAAFAMRPLDNELVFGFDLVSDNAGLLAQNAVVSVDSDVFWMGRNNFYHYDGEVRELPCTVDDFVFGDLDPLQIDKIYAGVNRDFNEVLWLYQSTSSTGDVNKYVKFNFKEGSWDVGTLDRTVWEEAKVYDNPIAISESGLIYDHEIGQDDGDLALNKYIESSFFDIEDGTDVMIVDQLLPDFIQSGLVQFTITTKKTPNSTPVVKGPYTLSPSTEKLSFRAKGRQAKIRYESADKGAKWEIGKPRYRVRQDGER